MNTTQDIVNTQNKTIIHICSAHVIHRFSYKLERKMKTSKKTKNMLLFVLARLIDCNSFEEIHQIFISLSISCFARNRYPEVEEYIAMLQRIITRDQEQVDLEIDYLAELDEELPNDLGDSITYKSSSPYGRHFESVLNKSKIFVNDLENKYSDSLHFEENTIFFCPKLPEFLATHYMPICPLWTGCILTHLSSPFQTNSRYSNAIAENWMRIIKNNILSNEVKLRPADFIRKVHQGIHFGLLAKNRPKFDIHIFVILSLEMVNDTLNQGSPNCGPQKPNMRPAKEYWPIEIFSSASFYLQLKYYII